MSQISQPLQPGSLTDPHQESDTAENASSEPQYLTGFKLALMTGIMTVIMFIMTLNGSVVATAIPSITSTFHSINDIGWYGAAYLVSNCTLQPLSGKIYTLYSAKHTFLTFLCIFELGSLISATSRSSTMLIVGRAITGVGGAGQIGGALTILGTSCPMEKRPTLIGIVTGIGAVGQIIGPLIGGALTEHLSWRWCFYLNLPIGVAVFFLSLALKFPESPQSPLSYIEIPQRLDLIGFAVFAPGIIMLLLAFQWGGSTHDWGSSVIIGLFVGAACLIVLFGFWEHRMGQKAMIPMALLKQRVVFSACITAMLQMGGMLALSYFLPTWFQLVKGDSPTSSGIHILPTFLSQIMASVGTGVAVSKTGYYTPFALFGSALTITGAGLYTTFTPSTPKSHWLCFQLLTGFGRGMAMQQSITAIQANTSPTLLPIVSSLIPFCQYFGSALFVSLGTTVFTNRLAPALRLYAPGVDPAVVIAAGATGLRHVVSEDELAGVLLAANKALTETFYLSVGTAGAAFMATWGLGWKKIEKSKKKEKRKDTGTVENVREKEGDLKEMGTEV